jgi:hypothetical protein
LEIYENEYDVEAESGRAVFNGVRSRQGRVLLESEMENDELIRYLLNTVKKVTLDTIIEKGYEKRCSCCWADFEEKGEYLQLGCHESHIFHYECL